MSLETLQSWIDTGELRTLAQDEANFEYRHSGLDTYFCVTGATLALKPGDANTITARMQTFYKQKVATQPFAEENAGCMFKNPPGDSGWTTDRHQRVERLSHWGRGGFYGAWELYSQYRQCDCRRCVEVSRVYPRSGTRKDRDIPSDRGKTVGIRSVSGLETPPTSGETRYRG